MSHQVDPMLIHMYGKHVSQWTDNRCKVVNKKTEVCMTVLTHSQQITTTHLGLHGVTDTRYLKMTWPIPLISDFPKFKAQPIP